MARRNRRRSTSTPPLTIIVGGTLSAIALYGVYIIGTLNLRHQPVDPLFAGMVGGAIAALPALLARTRRDPDPIVVAPASPPMEQVAPEIPAEGD